MKLSEQPLPLDDLTRKGAAAWLVACLRTVGRIMTGPRRSFAVVQEPVDHTRTLGLLATLRLPSWLALEVLLVVRWATRDSDVPRPPPVTVLDADLGFQFVEVLSSWLLLMVPIGLPLLYFMGGISAHMGLGMTGGARRSVGTSMRAFGLALAPAMLLIGLLDFPLHLRMMSPELWLVLVGGVCFPSFVALGVGLARTHQTRIVRGFLVAIVPIAIFFGVSFGRALLELDHLPFAPETTPDPYGARFEIE